ncbi:hypothetical protein BDQ12DRAFT_686491 [Crucibulum laeve]|uniref:Uncharacterized protein n=1 Tax=Crucibulum laeve TaxID=68775 RepID=A0A5C3LTQ4_9AGAR|nr:hypothetical protein BDQ12DRAFT_686491 [Crucibulum laeve]
MPSYTLDEDSGSIFGNSRGMTLALISLVLAYIVIAVVRLWACACMLKFKRVRTVVELLHTSDPNDPYVKSIQRRFNILLGSSIISVPFGITIIYLSSRSTSPFFILIIISSAVDLAMTVRLWYQYLCARKAVQAKPMLPLHQDDIGALPVGHTSPAPSVKVEA